MERRFDVFRHVAAPRALVWSVLTDHAHYSRWARLPYSELECEGADVPDGVGAIRRLGGGPLVVREQVVAFEPPESFSYVILSGVPVDGYRADVELVATSDGGTDVRWRGEFRSAPPGLRRVVRATLRLAVVALADRLVVHCERVARGSTTSS